MGAAQMSMWDHIEERDRILASMAENHKIYLEALRSFARVIALRNPQRHVCIDDVRRMMLEKKFPTPEDIKCKSGERIFGAVFKTNEFEPVHQINTTRPERIARSGSTLIWVYRLKEAA